MISYLKQNVDTISTQHIAQSKQFYTYIISLNLLSEKS